MAFTKNMTNAEVRAECERLYPCAENVSQRAKDAAWQMAWDCGRVFSAYDVAEHYNWAIEIAQIAANDACRPPKGD